MALVHGLRGPDGMSEKGQGVEVHIDEGMALDPTGNEVEIEMRSDFILDSSGETIDAGARGGEVPGGEDTPGSRPD